MRPAPILGSESEPGNPFIRHPESEFQIPGTNLMATPSFHRPLWPPASASWCIQGEVPKSFPGGPKIDLRRSKIDLRGPKIVPRSPLGPLGDPLGRPWGPLGVPLGFSESLGPWVPIVTLGAPWAHGDPLEPIGIQWAHGPWGPCRALCKALRVLRTRILCLSGAGFPRDTTTQKVPQFHPLNPNPKNLFIKG